MESANRFIKISVLALGIAGALASGHAHAAAFQLKENSVKAQGRAMAGAGSALGDASVVVNNPAVMSTFTEKAIQVDVTAIDLSYQFTGGGSAAAGSPLQQPLTGGDGGDAGGLAAVPAMAIVLPLSDRFEYLTVGAMVSAPFGLKTEYDRDWVGRYHAVESDLKFIDLTLAASVELSDRFSVGFGAIYEHAEVTLSNAIDLGSGLCANPQTTALCFLPNPIQGPFGPQKNDGFVSINGTSNSLGWLVGLNWRPTDSVSLGYSYRSEIDHEISGTADFQIPANVRAVVGPNIYRPGNVEGSGGGADLTTPDTHTFSGTWMVNDRFSLMAEAILTGWDSLEEVRIQFENPAQADSAEDYLWEDSWFYSVGGEYRFSDAFTFRAGVARDDSPVSRPYRTPRLPDQDRMWYAIGLTWSASPNLDISANYVKIDIVDTPEVDIVSTSGSRITGDFEGGADLYGISAQYRF
jgi:long-chain fatty acid transport protein